MAKKGYIYPIKKKILLILLLNLFGIVVISKFFRFVNIFSEIYSIIFREVEKSLPLHKGAFLCSSMTRQFFPQALHLCPQMQNTAYLFRDIPYSCKTVL